MEAAVGRLATLDIWSGSILSIQDKEIRMTFAVFQVAVRLAPGVRGDTRQEHIELACELAAVNVDAVLGTMAERHLPKQFEVESVKVSDFWKRGSCDERIQTEEA